jgi:hypothetical protein
MSGYVSYDNHNSVYVALARLIRSYYVWKGRHVGGKNIAIVLVNHTAISQQQDIAIIATSDTSSNTHSEPAVVTRLHEIVNQLNVQRAASKTPLIDVNKCSENGLMSVYTERAPCGTGPGMRNCTGYLAKNQPTMAVWYSFQYPSSGKQELDTIIDIHSSLGIYNVTGCETLRESFNKMGQADRLDVTKTLKGIDKQLTALDQAGIQHVVGKNIETALQRYNVIPC